MNKEGSQLYTLLGYAVLLSLLLLATAVIGGVVYWALRSGHMISDEAFTKWVGLTCFTVAVFGWTIKQYRPSRHDQVFWIALGGLLVVHLAVFSVILTRVIYWRLSWFAILCILELIPITAALDWTRDRFRRHDRRNRSTDVRHKPL